MDKSTYPRCRDCKWWGEQEMFRWASEHSYKPAFEVRYCDCPHVVHVQDMPDHYDKESGQKPIDESSAFTQDGSDYASSFHTGPDFGCVHWQAKEGT